MCIRCKKCKRIDSRKSQDYKILQDQPGSVVTVAEVNCNNHKKVIIF